MIEPTDAHCIESDPCDGPTRVHGRHPVWTRLELAEGARITFARSYVTYGSQEGPCDPFMKNNARGTRAPSTTRSYLHTIEHSRATSTARRTSWVLSKSVNTLVAGGTPPTIRSPPKSSGMPKKWF